MNRSFFLLVLAVLVILGASVWVLFDMDQPRSSAPVPRQSSLILDQQFGKSDLGGVSERIEIEKRRLKPDEGQGVSSRIKGHVLDAFGNPVGDAQVHSQEGQLALSKKNGEFDIQGLDGGEYWLWAEAEGYASIPAPPVRLADNGSETGILLRLEAAQSLSGTVTTLQGDFIAGARVEARVTKVESAWGLPVSSAPNVVKTDTTGCFTISPLPKGDIELIVRHPDYHPFGRTFSTDTNDVSLTLTPAGVIYGRVTKANSEKNPTVDRVTVLVSKGEEEGPWRPFPTRFEQSGEEAESGHFRASVRSLRWLKVVVEGPGMAPLTSEAFRVNRETFGYGPILMSAESGMTLKCRTTDAQGKPIANADIRVIDVETGAASTTVRTNSKGFATTSPMASGRYRVEASHPSHFDGESDVIELPREEGEMIELSLVSASSLKGRIKSSCAGTLPGLIAQMHKTDNPEFVSSVVLDKRFDFPKLDPGAYILRVVDASHPTIIHQEREVRLVPGRTKTIKMDFTNVGASLEGTYLLNGEPMAGAEVTLGLNASDASWVCRTDRNGRFHFSAIPEGHYLLRGRTEEGQPCYGVRPVDIVGNGLHREDVSLTTVAAAGRLVDSKQRPIARGRVFVEQQVGGERLRIAELKTNRDGVFMSNHLPSGALFVTTDVRFRKNLTQVSWKGGEGADLLELVLPEAGELTFHLKKTRDMAVQSSVELRVFDPSGVPVERSFEAGVRPKLTGLPKGPLEIHVTTSDGYSSVARAEVRAGKSRTVLVEF